MKKHINLLMLLLAVTTIVCCKAEEPKDYATFSGKLINYKGSYIQLIQAEVCPPKNRKIKIANDGTFSDTLHIDKAYFLLSIGNKTLQLFMKKGNNLKLSVDNKNFNKTLKFTGRDAKANNFIRKKNIIWRKYYDGTYFSLGDQEFSEAVSNIKNKTLNILEEYKNEIDKDFYLKEKECLLAVRTTLRLDRTISDIEDSKETFASFIGKPSPEFFNYENFNGGTSSLKDFKGKYVYIDVWSTG
jgi:hypothetical protein